MSQAVRSFRKTRLSQELPEQLASIGKGHGVHVSPSLSNQTFVAEAALSCQAVSARELAALTDALEALL